jgi:phenylalanyl-tRNA synthetase beta chain
MRTTVLGSLLDVARRNIAHDAERIALFESGRVYLDPSPTGLKQDADRPESDRRPLAGGFPGERAAPFAEPHRLACIAVGTLAAPSWRAGAEEADFFALKGALEGLADRLGVVLGFEEASEPFLHPGRAARVAAGGTDAGWIGELHPLVCREWGLQRAAGFEVGLAALVAAASAGEETFEDVTTYPAVRQDLAVVVPDDVSAARVRDAVLAGGGELLRSADVFDLYEGEQLGEGRKSLALRLEFRAGDRTLTDDEVAGPREAIAAKLGEIGGSLRE